MASKATIARLPIYLRYLREKAAAGEETISSTVIADELRQNPVQVRKDLALVSSVPGTPKLGFGVRDLIESIEQFLGFDNANDALLVGVGGLGRTLLAYEGFRNYGLNIVAAFDVNAGLFGDKVNGVPVFAMDKMQTTAKRLHIKMGIVTVPKEVAQSVADQMVASGIQAIWNFAPTHLKLPEGIAIKNEDLAASLAVLSKRLSDVIKQESE